MNQTHRSGDICTLVWWSYPEIGIKYNQILGFGAKFSKFYENYEVISMNIITTTSRIRTILFLTDTLDVTLFIVKAFRL